MTSDIARTAPLGEALVFVWMPPSAGAYGAQVWAPTIRLQAICTYTSMGPRERWGGGSETCGADHETAVPALDVSGMVKAIRDRDMPVATIAEMARVERRTVYAWLDGSVVRQANEARVRELHSLLCAWDSSLREMRRVWNRPSAGGPSLHDLLTRATINGPAITAAIADLRPAAEHRARQEAFRHVAAPGSRNPILDEIAVADVD